MALRRESYKRAIRSDCHLQQIALALIEGKAKDSVCWSPCTENHIAFHLGRISALHCTGEKVESRNVYICLSHNSDNRKKEFLKLEWLDGDKLHHIVLPPAKDLVNLLAWRVSKERCLTLPYWEKKGVESCRAMQGVNGRLHKREWLLSQDHLACFPSRQQQELLSSMSVGSGTETGKGRRRTRMGDREWTGSGGFYASPDGSCASLTNLSLDTPWKQLPILLDFMNQSSGSPSPNHSKTPLSPSAPASSHAAAAVPSKDPSSKKTPVPKDISLVRSDCLETGLIAFSDGIYESDGSAVVELRPIQLERDSPTPSQLSSVLAYLHHIHHKFLLDSGWEKSGGVTAVVDCRDGRRAREGVKICFLALSGLLEWVPGSLKRVFVVIQRLEAEEEREGHMAEKDWIPSEMDASHLKGELVTMEELHKTISGSQLTKEMGGDRVPHGANWLEFRKNLDCFLRNCRALGEYYVDLYKDMRRTSGTSAELWETAADEIQESIWRLKTKLEYIEKSDCFYFVRDVGEERLIHLQADYPDLLSLETYRKAVEKAAGLFREVCNIMGKASVSVDRRCRNLDMFVRAHAFLSQANELSTWADEVALPTADRQRKEPSVSLIRLRIQERQYEQFLAASKQKLEAGEKLLLASEWLWNWDGGGKGQESTLPFTEEQRSSIQKTWTNLVDKLEITDQNLTSVRDLLADSLICHHMLEKCVEVYDWALHNAKWSSQLGMLISAAGDPGESSSVTLDTLLVEVEEQLKKYPTQELRQLPIYAVRLQDDNVQAQAGDFETLGTRCGEAEEMLVAHRRKLEELIARSDEKSCGGSTEYEEPISRHRMAHNASDDLDSCRRRSFAGTASTSLTAVSESYEFRYRPLFLEKGGSQSRLNTIPSDENDSIGEDVAHGIITADMTDQVVSSMSTNTLKKRLAERKTTGETKEGGWRKAAPDPLPPPFLSCRIGSARSAKSKKPFRKLMKRSTTCDGMSLCGGNPPPQTVPNLSIHLATPFKDTVRQASLLSLTSVGEESLNSLSVSSGASLESSARGCPSFRAPPPPSLAVVPSVEDDASSSKSGSGKFHSHSSSPTDFEAPSLREEDFRLDSPPPDASPDLRMQLMIINELIQTELNYVGSLHYVIEHYVPEMQREDLPQELRGQRYAIFGNLEKVYDFHVQDFLPQLQARIRKGKQSDAIGLEVARCFLDNRAKFHLYALYNKNKPKSDLLMSECGAVFFRTRQLVLKDKLDLGSYLLKPVQRMGKYALLLQHLLSASPSDDQETTEVIKKAEEMVSFQLRHGNDLLAMDMIRGCDLNLKEQGQLLRQDEFVVWEGRGIQRKCLRRVFLFEHLVLFAKPRRSRAFRPGRQILAGGVLSDTYQYKHSIKMNDVGLTEEVKDSKVKFELWFRRHTSSTTTVLQSHSEALRNSWVEEIRRLLWRQAIRNRENRLTEMSSMGMGSKTGCLDLKTSGTIQDRAVNSTLLNKVGNRFRSSFSTLSSSSNFGVKARILGGSKGVDEGGSVSGGSKRPHSLISLGSSSCSSNSSSLGSTATPLQGSSHQHHPAHSFEIGMSPDLSALEEDPDDETGGSQALTTPPLKVVGESNPVTAPPFDIVATKQILGREERKPKKMSVTETSQHKPCIEWMWNEDEKDWKETERLDVRSHIFSWNTPRPTPFHADFPIGMDPFRCQNVYWESPWISTLAQKLENILGSLDRQTREERSRLKQTAFSSHFNFKRSMKLNKDSETTYKPLRNHIVRQRKVGIWKLSQVEENCEFLLESLEQLQDEQDLRSDTLLAIENIAGNIEAAAGFVGDALRDLEGQRSRSAHSWKRIRESESELHSLMEYGINPQEMTELLETKGRRDMDRIQKFRKILHSSLHSPSLIENQDIAKLEEWCDVRRADEPLIRVERGIQKELMLHNRGMEDERKMRELFKSSASRKTRNPVKGTEEHFENFYFEEDGMTPRHSTESD